MKYNSLKTLFVVVIRFVLQILCTEPLEGILFRNHLILIDSTEIASGVDLVDAVYLINLDKRPDRLAYMRVLLDKYKIHPIRVPACDGSLISDDVIQQLTGDYYVDNFLRKDRNRNLYGAIGCLLSHLSILQDAFDKEFQVIWVLEDDIKIVGDVSQIPKLLAELFYLDRDWDILYTDLPAGASVMYPPHNALLFSKRNKSQFEKCGRYFNTIYWRYGTYSMLISRKGIEKILDYFQYSDVYGPIDNDLHCIPGIREYSVQADIVTHTNLFKSDIENLEK